AEMRRAGAEVSRVQPLARELAELGRRVSALEERLSQVPSAAPPPPSAAGGDVEAMLSADQAAARLFGARVAEVRGRMVAAANDAALRGLGQLRSDTGGYLRRSRIGRIDAVMGSKRRIEIQIES